MSHYKTLRLSSLKGSRWVAVKLIAHRDGPFFVMRQFGPLASMGGNWNPEPLYAGDNLLLATDTFNAEVGRWRGKGYGEVET